MIDKDNLVKNINFQIEYSQSWIETDWKNEENFENKLEFVRRIAFCEGQINAFKAVLLLIEKEADN